MGEITTAFSCPFPLSRYLFISSLKFNFPYVTVDLGKLNNEEKCVMLAFAWETISNCKTRKKMKRSKRLPSDWWKYKFELLQVENVLCTYAFWGVAMPCYEIQVWASDRYNSWAGIHTSHYFKAVALPFFFSHKFKQYNLSIFTITVLLENCE